MTQTEARVHPHLVPIKMKIPGAAVTTAPMTVVWWPCVCVKGLTGRDLLTAPRDFSLAHSPLLLQPTASVHQPMPPFRPGTSAYLFSLHSSSSCLEAWLNPKVQLLSDPAADSTMRPAADLQQGSFSAFYRDSSLPATVCCCLSLELNEPCRGLANICTRSVMCVCVCV